jgi:hypothetical protein
MADETNEEMLEKTNIVPENENQSDILADSLLDENSDSQEDALFEKTPSSDKEDVNDDSLLENDNPFEEETTYQKQDEESLIENEEQLLEDDSSLIENNAEEQEVTENIPETPVVAGPPKSHNFTQNTDSVEENTPLEEKTAEETKNEETVLKEGEATQKVPEPVENKETSEDKKEKKTDGRMRGFFREATKRVVVKKSEQNENLPPPPSFKNDVKKVLKYFFFMPMFLLLLIAGGIFATVFFASPRFIRSFLDKKGLSDISYTVISKGLTEMTLTNVTDPDGHFEIGKITLKYDLLDFFKKRIRIMSVENLNLTMSDDKNSFSFSSFPTFLKLVAGSNDVEIDSIQIHNSNAVLHSDGKEIPLEFSANGYFKSGMRFSIPFNFKDKDISVEKGTLSISQQAQDTVFDISLDKANYTLTEGQALTVLGSAKIIFTSSADLKSANISLSLGEDNKIKATVKESARNVGYYDMNVQWTENFFEPYFFKRDFQNVVDVSLGDIKFYDNYKSFSSYTSMKVNLQNTLIGETFIHQAQAVSLGSLSCSYGVGCSYKLMSDKALKLALTGIYSSLNGNTFYITKPIVTEIKSVQDDYLFSFEKGQKNISVLFPVLAFQGTRYYNSLETPFYLQARSLSYKYTKDEKDLSFNMSSPQMNLITADFSLGDAVLNMNFAQGQLQSLSLQSARVELADKKLFDKPLLANLTINDKREISAKISPDATPLEIIVKGTAEADYSKAYLNFSTNTLSFTPAFQPSQVFSLFKDVNGTVSGSAAAYGDVTVSPNKLQVEKVSLSPSNLSFPVGEWGFYSVSGDTAFKSILPPVSLPNQMVKMKSLTTPLFKMNNIRMSYTLEGDKKLVKLKNISFSVKGIPTYSEDISLSYMFTGAPYVFQFYNVEGVLQEYFAPKNLFIQGKISANMTFQMKNGVAEIVKIELVPESQVTMRYKGQSNEYLSAYQEDALQNYSFEGGEIALTETGKDFTIRLTGSPIKEGGVPEKKELFFRYPLTLLTDFFKNED